MTIDILATREDEEYLLAETKYIMVARHGTSSATVPGLLLANDEVRFEQCLRLQLYTKECLFVPLSYHRL